MTGNGNILTMYQYGLKTPTSSDAIDKLGYHYIPGSNKLQYVVDAVNDPNSTLGDFKYAITTKTAITVDYTYDGNGNMTSDQNKKITGISYNILNLPSVITVAGKGAIKCYYDATGNKLQKRTTDNPASPHTTVTTNIGDAVYQNDILQLFGTAEGRVRGNTAKTAWIYDYFLKDHLGNTRMMITDDFNVSSPILEAYSYYPFGLQQKKIGLTAGSPLHNYKNTFQKQEFNEDLGVDLYEFRYRMNDPQIGRFWQIDPLAYKYVYNSTYAFSENKVINAIELEGLEILKINSAWFRMYTQTSKTGRASQKVIINKSKIPSAFKDKSGTPLFLPSSVNIGVNGKILTGKEKGLQLMEGNRLPPYDPSWPWSGATPEAPNSVAGGNIGLNLQNNRIIAIKQMQLPMHPKRLLKKWYDTYKRKKPIWDAYGELYKNQTSFDIAVKLTNQYKQGQFKTGLINFINDGTLPNFQFSETSILEGINIMSEGMRIMKNNDIYIGNETEKTYNMYKKLLEIIREVNKNN